MRGTLARRPDLVALRAAVYRPGATPADIEALEQALGEPGDEEQAHPVEPAAVPEGADSGEAGSESRRRGFRRRPLSRRRAALAAVAAAVVGCAAGAALALLAQPSGASMATVPTLIHIGTTAGDAVFQRAQRAADRPGIPLDPVLEARSLRRLLIAGRIQLYAARDRSGGRCLVGVQGGAVVSCVAADRFSRSGLRLLWSSDVLTVDAVGLRELRSRLVLVAEWRPDGRVTLGAVPR